MSYMLPAIPKEFSAEEVAKNIHGNNLVRATFLREECLKIIQKQVFPCEVRITNTDRDIIVSQVVLNIATAGYKVEVVTRKELENDYQGDYPVVRKYIVINNPFVPEIQ